MNCKKWPALKNPRSPSNPPPHQLLSQQINKTPVFLLQSFRSIEDSSVAPWPSAVPTETIDTLKRTLIIFVKSPIPGDVKTRLIPHLTGIEAADLYKCFVADTLKKVTQISPCMRTQVAYQPHSKASDLSWLGLKNPPEIFKQDGRSLGERLIHAFGQAFGRGARQIVIIGSDSPNLPKCYIEQAFTALEEADVVLGPAHDGGYYLIGLSRPCLKLFDDVSWSTDQVFERTAQNAQNLGYSLKVLPFHYDIDTIEDLKTLHSALLQDEKGAPATKKYLEQLARCKSFFLTS
jgi:rSAM/selenodomain-associated transferase 1